MNKIYQLDSSLPALGIFREDFFSPFRATISAAAIYQNTPLYVLMEYQQQGEHYYFEDSCLQIYSPDTPGKKSTCLLSIKPVFFAENEEVIFYLDSKLENYDPVNTAVAFKITYKDTQNSYVGSLITPQAYIEVLKRVKRKNDPEKLFLLPEFYEEIVKELTAEVIQEFFERSSWKENSERLAKLTDEKP